MLGKLKSSDFGGVGMGVQVLPAAPHIPRHRTGIWVLRSHFYFRIYGIGLEQYADQVLSTRKINRYSAEICAQGLLPSAYFYSSTAQI